MQKISTVRMSGKKNVPRPNFPYKEGSRGRLSGGSTY